MVQKISTRIAQKHDLEVNWLNSTLIPMQGELIIYDIEVDASGGILTNEDGSLKLPEGRTAPYTYERFKIGNGIDTTSALPFIDETLNIESTKVTHAGNLLSDLINTYILDLDYNALAFDTSELVVSSNSTSVLGQAILGQLILA